MQGSHSSSYGYGYQTVTSSRYSSQSHATSSAFSASANPNEDWTKISDLAERRRIQNRIAQRNYRKKLKRRLEDLERRAASSSASPEQEHEELDNAHSDASSGSSIRTPPHSSGSSDGTRGASPEALNIDAYPSPEERGPLFGQQCTRQLSTSPPPAFSYVTWGFQEPPAYPSYPQHTAYNTIPVSYAEYSYDSQYLPPLAASLPSMMAPNPAIKKESLYGVSEEDIMSPFSLNYATMTGIDLQTSHSHSGSSNANTPPLTHVSSSFGQSRENSPLHSLPSLSAPVLPSSPLMV